MKAFFHHLRHPPCYLQKLASAMCLSFYHLANMNVISGQNVFQIPVWFQNECHIHFFFPHKKNHVCFRFRAQNSEKRQYGDRFTTRRQKFFSKIKGNDIHDLKKVLTRDFYIYYNVPKRQSHSTHRFLKVTRWMHPSV